MFTSQDHTLDHSGACFLPDFHEHHIGDQGDPSLTKYRPLSRAVKSFDHQMLLDPLKKQFDLLKLAKSMSLRYSVNVEFVVSLSIQDSFSIESDRVT